MILPSKHLSEDRALLTVGARILQRLNRPKNISALWEEMRRDAEKKMRARLSYDWFVLALDLLFAVDAIELHDGVITKKSSPR